MPGPDFPTGGIIVDTPAMIEEAYRTGRGGFRVRARWHKEDLGRGTWVVVITQIPWLVQKGRLIEKLAELLSERKLPLVGDIRDESAEDIRVVIEPKSRNVDDAMMMESLFRLSELESRIPLNMNVLVEGPGAAGAVARARRCGSGSTIAATCWAGARATGSRRSRSGWRCWPATSSPISTSTR